MATDLFCVNDLEGARNGLREWVKKWVVVDEIWTIEDTTKVTL